MYVIVFKQFNLIIVTCDSAIFHAYNVQVNKSIIFVNSFIILYKNSMILEAGKISILIH